MNRECKTEYVHYSIDDDILFAEFIPFIEHDINIAKKVVEDRLNFTGNENYRAVVDITNIKGSTREARIFMSRSDFGYKGLIAVAFISKRLFSVFLLNIFLKVYKPTVPSRFFHCRHEAIKWLKLMQIN